MDQQTRNPKWMLTIFLCAIGLLFGYTVYNLITKGIDPAYRRWMVSTSSESSRKINKQKQPMQKPDQSLLIKDQGNTIGRLKLTYRGIQSNAILIDCVLIEMDREYVYRRQIPIKEAERGFQVSEQRFRLAAIEKDRIRILTAEKLQ